MTMFITRILSQRYLFCQHSNVSLLSEILLETDNPAKALSVLNDPIFDTATSEIYPRIFEYKAKAYELLHNPLSALKQRIALDKILEGSTARENNRKIWEDLNQLDLNILKRQRLINSGGLLSWLELAIIYQSTYFNSELFELQVNTWAQHYSDHPANSFLIQELLRSSQETGFRPNHIALILPLTGPYEPYSKAIREGFLGAWFLSKEYKPVINVYDANSLNIIQVYQNAIEKGADFVVGPLEKEGVKALIDNGDFPVTVLALNQYSPTAMTNVAALNNNESSNIIQFGLVPEDEARQIAIKAYEQGLTKALVIAPEGDWGSRLFNSFRGEWENQNGRIVDFITYRNNEDDFSFPVKRLLNVTSSESRAKLLQQKLNKSVKSETRLRQDADMIFLVADPVDARQLVPQLQFHRAHDLPVYSTSYLYSGIQAPELDKDINGVLFTDIPWVIREDGSEIKRLLNQNWSANNSQFNRLFALGVDAYQIIPHLKRLSEQRTMSYAGQTGDLYLSENGHIQRYSNWAQFKEGIPELQPWNNSQIETEPY
jgi:outer membrane PBP1 activator LpoA protein